MRRDRTLSGRARVAAWLAPVVVLLASCAGGGLELPETPADRWVPTEEALAATAPPEESETAPALPAGLPEDVDLSELRVDLPLVVSVALANNPLTRDSWLAARAAQAEVGVRSADYYPRLDLSITGEKISASAVGGQFEFDQTSLDPALSLSWLLFDFGGRASEVEEARRLLWAAGFQHNRTLQRVVLEVERAYFSYQSARAALAAAREDLAGAQKNLEAAEARREAGVATIADVLQVRTAVESARLRVQELEGRIQSVRGALATAMGVPVDIPIDVAPLPQEVAAKETLTEVDAWLARAMTERPDLAAARARAAAARSNLEATRAERYPEIAVGGALDRVFYEEGGASTNTRVGVSLTMPLFTGFDLTNRIQREEAEAARAANAAGQLADQVALEVWSAYYDARTAAQQIQTSQALLASAEQNAQVARGRYEAGVGDILDLVAAQATLADARAQAVAARSNWLLALANLGYASGALEVQEFRPPTPKTPNASGDDDEDA